MSQSIIITGWCCWNAMCIKINMQFNSEPPQLIFNGITWSYVSQDKKTSQRDYVSQYHHTKVCVCRQVGDTIVQVCKKTTKVTVR